MRDVCRDMPDAELIDCFAREVSNSACHSGDLHGRKVNSTADVANNVLQHYCTDRPSSLQCCQHYDIKEFTTLTTTRFNKYLLRKDKTTYLAPVLASVIYCCI